MNEQNVLGGALEACGLEPVTGWFRDGTCATNREDIGSHTVCAVMTAEFLHHQKALGNDLTAPVPRFQFPGLEPGDRWCVTVRAWKEALADGLAPPVVLASTHEKALDVLTLQELTAHAVDIPDDPSALVE